MKKIILMIGIMQCLLHANAQTSTNVTKTSQNSDRIVSGTFSTKETISSTWIKTNGTTIIASNENVLLDANLNNGYIVLNPGFISAPTSKGSFIAQIVNGSNTNNTKLKNSYTSEEDEIISNSSDDFTEKRSETNITISPNPAKNSIKLTSSDEQNLIEIFSISGVKVFSQKVNSNVVEIDISSFTNGIYILKVVSTSYTNTIKFSKE